MLAYEIDVLWAPTVASAPEDPKVGVGGRGVEKGKVGQGG
jgi:hypothetical protein